MTAGADPDGALPGDLIALREAAALAYDRVYSSAGRIEREAALNIMAHALCDLSPIYTYDERKERIRALRSFELIGGVFTDGATKLCFPDRRPQISRIAMYARDVRTVIATLISSGISFEAIHVPPGAGK